MHYDLFPPFKKLPRILSETIKKKIIIIPEDTSHIAKFTEAKKSASGVKFGNTADACAVTGSESANNNLTDPPEAAGSGGKEDTSSSAWARRSKDRPRR